MIKTIAATLIILLTTGINSLYGQTKFQNNKYGFSAQVPSDWTLYAEVKDDPSDNSAFIEWGLPEVYCEHEKTGIENAISIKAYKLSSIKDIKGLVELEFKNIGQTVQSKEQIETSPHTSYNVITTRHGLKYKSKITFMFKNNVGYVLRFTATPETYDVNISKFKDFTNSLKLSEAGK
ncbi:MAG: hypothetical protein ACK5MG_06555 [Bacteroidales bacterium]